MGVHEEATAAPRDYAVVIADDDDLLKGRLRGRLGGVERKYRRLLSKDLSHDSRGGAEEGCEHLVRVQASKNRPRFNFLLVTRDVEAAHGYLNGCEVLLCVCHLLLSCLVLLQQSSRT